MKEIKPEQLTQNIIDLIGHQWMLITAGNSADYNMMTASWGGMGYLWNKPVATIYVRPEPTTAGPQAMPTIFPRGCDGAAAAHAPARIACTSSVTWS